MGFGKNNTGAILRDSSNAPALGALAFQDAVVLPNVLVLAEDFRILKSIIVASVKGLTAGEGGGLVFGMANGELTAAEIEESIEATGPNDRNDRLAQERAERNVQVLGATAPEVAASATQLPILNGEGGPVITNKFRWTYSNPEGWTFWIYNLGTVLTTGATLEMIATHYGVWVT